MMQKGLIVKKQIFIKQHKEDIRQYYDIEPKEIGHGTFGKIYLGRQKDKPQIVRAIKMIKKQYNHSFKMTETIILKELDHPSILKLFAIYEDQHSYYLVTDYLEGGDLLTRLQRKPFSEGEIKQIFGQVLNAIAYCHQLHIVHRDIKLENVLFVKEKTLALKLIDFGLAYKWNADLKFQLRKQGKNIPIGSILYLSPESLKGTYSEKCDLWSLAVVLYTLVSAQFPFNGKTDKQIQKNINTMNFTIPIQKLQVSEALKDLLSKLFVPEMKRLSTTQIFEHPWMKGDQQKSALKLNFGKLANFSKFSKMKTLAVTYIASQLSQKQIQKMSTLFRQLDTNHDGFLSIDQIQKAFQSQRQKSSITQLNKLIQKIDTDKNGKINYTEFISCCLQNSIVLKQQNLKSAFRLLDKDQNGKIEKSELNALLKGINLSMVGSGKDIDASVIEEMMKSCDKNGDGLIDYKEFVECITKR